MSAPAATPAPSPIRALVAGASVSLLGAAATAVFGLARVKGLALVLGPGDLGVYGQLWIFVLYAGTFAALGIGIGTTKIAARERERRDVDGISAIIFVAIALPIAVGTVFLLATLAGATHLAPLLLGSDRVALFVLAALSIPLVALQTTLQGLVQGFEDARGQAAVLALYGACFTALSIVGAVVAGVTGAVVALSLGNVILAVLYLARTRTLAHRAGASVRPRVRSRILELRALLRSLLPIGAAALAGFAVFSIADVAVRTALIHGSGKVAAGLWFGLMSISLQFLALLVTAITYFTAPLAARAGVREDAEGIRRILDDSLRLTILAVVPVIALIVALRAQFVDALFSEKFAPMAHYVPAQMGADLLRTLAWPLSLALVPLGMTMAWAAIGIGASAVYCGVGTFLALRFGLGGAVAGYIVLWGLAAAGTVFVVVRRGLWRPSPRSAVGLALSGVAFAAAVVLPELAAVGAVLLITVCLVFAVAAPTERAYAVSWVAALTGRAEVS